MALAGDRVADCRRHLGGEDLDLADRVVGGAEHEAVDAVLDRQHRQLVGPLFDRPLQKPSVPRWRIEPNML